MCRVFEDGNSELQPYLDCGGEADITTPGIYVLNRPLVIGPRTRLYLRQGVVIKAAPRSLCSLIENASFRVGGSYDEDIEIVGGIWDGNCDEQGLEPLQYALARNEREYDAERFTGKMMRFAHVAGFVLRDALLRDPVSYGVQIADAKGFSVRDLHFDYNCRFGTTDGVHVNGPACDGEIIRMHGTTNDDMVSLTTVDERHAEVTRGPIERVVIDGVHAEGGYTGVRLLSCGEPLTDVAVRNVTGTYRHNAISLTHHNIHPGEPIWMDRIVIDGVYASKSDKQLTDDRFTLWDRSADIFNSDPVVWFAKGIKMGEAELRNVERTEETASLAPTVKIDRDVSIEKLTMKNIRHSFRYGQEFEPIINEGSIGETEEY